MTVVIPIAQINILLPLVEIQNVIVPMTGCLRVQVMEYLPVRAGNRSVENLLDKIRMALVGLGDIGGAICVPLNEPLIPVFSPAGYKNDFFTRWRSHIQAVPVLILAWTAASLKEVQHSVAVAVQDIQPCRRCRDSGNQMYLARVLL